MGLKRFQKCRGLLAGLSLSTILAGCHGKGATAADDSADTPAPPALVSVSTVVVAPTTLQQTITVTGILAPLSGAETRVSPAVPGRVARVLVQPGERVSQGQLVAVLEPGSVSGQLQQAAAAASAASAVLTQSRSSYASAVATNTAAVQSARTNLQAAEVALQKVLAGSRPEEIAHAESDLAAAEATEANARQNLEREQRLLAEGLVAKKDVEAAQLMMQTSDAAVEAARNDLRLKQQPNRPQDIAAAGLAVQQARDALNAAIVATSQNQVKAGDVAIASRQLQASEGSLAAARAQLSAEYLRAPVSGTVVQRLVNQGEYLDTTGAVCTIVNLRSVQLLLQAPPAVVGSVLPGDPVLFTTESQPGHTYQARVTMVSTAVTAGTNTVQVTAVASNPNGTLRDDGFVQAQIVTSVRPNALAVPSGAIVTVDEKPTLFVVGKDSITHAHPVTLGLRQGDMVEILSGVAAGDRVVTTGAYELSDGTKVQVGAGGG